MSVPAPKLRDFPGFLGLPLIGPTEDLASEPGDAIDAGYFGPDSVTWKVMREPMMVFAAARALLLQVAHSLVAAGARHHSRYREDPFDRLKETGKFVGIMTFGTKAQADRKIHEINEKHHKVTGVLEDWAATAATPGGTAYKAMQPDLLRWVHATMVDTLLVSYEAFVRPLSPEDADRFVREWNVIGHKMGIRNADLFASWDELRRYMADEISSGIVRVGEGSMEVAATLLQSPFAVSRPIWPRVLDPSLYLLPEALRSQYGVRWTRRDDLRVAAGLLAERTARQMIRVGLAHTPGARRFHTPNRWNPLDPRRLNTSGSYDRALRRATTVEPVTDAVPGLV